MQPDSAEAEVIRRLFHEHVPEIASAAVEIRGIAREPGNRTLVAVESKVPAVDAVGARLGNRGSRVTAMLANLPGEKIDIVTWSSSLEQFITNLVAPNRSIRVSLDHNLRRATIMLAPDSTLLSSDMGGIRLRLASRLVGWELKVAPQPA